ncbi:hypothetical protein SG34_033660 [Thalassomonas viridans]|uniref:Uncharacterized protein n=1 Tax=Thalassomonas viridans TaxID=137584 RepID=A0AAE9Z9P3_9GAMM|nr:hypothetical protein [Thalassomonas viridans]WDE08842.1 hypothetical protein SG34_033660 [Thalassomonas viridans]
MKTIFLTSTCLTFISFSAAADYLMELKDNSGSVIDSQCVKSYSHSNNLASIRNSIIEKEQTYSYEESLTNIIYLDRPVYRRVIAVDGVYNRTLGSYPEIDFLVRDVINMRQAGGANTFSGYDITNVYADIRLNADKTLDIVSSFSPSYGYTGEAVIEYTKVGDYGSYGSDSYKEYAHYVLSSSLNDEVVTVIINDKSVTFQSGYSFDAATGACVKE